MSSDEINLARKFIKERIQKCSTTFHGNKEKWQNIQNLLKRTGDGESNSLIIIGPRGSGKTTLVNSVINSLLLEESFKKNTLIVCLNGLIETDDRLALKSITTQLNLINVANGKVFGSFADNLSFLLSCLSNANSKTSKSIIFILEEFDLFCHHHGQTLLYNLFDISQSAKVPICVLGITCRLDVIELLEKRVKSRYSHRQIYLFHNECELKDALEIFRQNLLLPSKEEIANSRKYLNVNQDEEQNNLFLRRQFNQQKYNFNRTFINKWNQSIEILLNNSVVKECIEGLLDHSLSEDYLKKFLFRLISIVNSNHPILLPEDVQQLSAEYSQDDKILILAGLSVLEMCLIIAIKHHCEIYDYDPFNFEIIYQRFFKFASKSTVMQSVDRAVALKAFEHIKSLELILPLNSSFSKVKKDFQMHKLALSVKQINLTVNIYNALPTEVSQWAKNNFL